MAKNKISEFSSTPANNTDIGGINIAEGCAPSGINNAIRELMAQLKDQQSGTDSDNFAVGGNLTVAGTSTFTGVTTFTAVPVIPSTIGFVPTGVIVMWSGSIATIPSGWLLCNGASGTPDLRDRFIVGAGSTYAVTATGGSADAITVAHTHTFSGTSAATDPGLILGTYGSPPKQVDDVNTSSNGWNTQSGSHTHTYSGTTASTGVSGTNANLPPYYALAYIMKS